MSESYSHQHPLSLPSYMIDKMHMSAEREGVQFSTWFTTLVEKSLPELQEPYKPIGALPIQIANKRFICFFSDALESSLVKVSNKLGQTTGMTIYQIVETYYHSYGINVE